MFYIYMLYVYMLPIYIWIMLPGCCMHVCVYVCMHVCTYTYTYVYKCIYKQMYMCMYIYIYVYAFPLMYPHFVLESSGIVVVSLQIFPSPLFLVICEVHYSTNMFFYASTKFHCYIFTNDAVELVSLLRWSYSPF